VFGVAWGALFLGEHITLTTVGGLVIVLGSVALVTDVRLTRLRTSRSAGTAVEQSVP
jgi:drug/metabolite transporter (DMT)-like permease